MIYLDLQPFSLVEDRGFRELLHFLERRYEIPSRRTLSRRLPLVYDRNRVLVEKMMSESTAVSLTSDIWSSRRSQGYLTITAHFITPNWELKSCVLSTERILGAHTGENIAECIKVVMTQWNIVNKVFAMVSDNAANMKKAVDMLNLKHVPCFAHTLHLLVNESLDSVKGFSDIRTKIKKIVSYFHHSVKGSDILETQHKHNSSAIHH